MFLSSAADNGFQRNAAPDIQGTDSLWTVEFMGGEGEQINLLGFDIDVRCV